MGKERLIKLISVASVEEEKDLRKIRFPVILKSRKNHI
jgi:hypothetical protein